MKQSEKKDDKYYFLPRTVPIKQAVRGPYDVSMFAERQGVCAH